MYLLFLKESIFLQYRIVGGVARGGDDKAWQGAEMIRRGQT